MILVALFCQLNVYQQSENIMLTNIPKLGSVRKVDTETALDNYDYLIDHYAGLYNIDPQLVKLIIQKESQFNPRAVSRSGALGLMQLMPETAKHLGVKKPFDPAQNIEGGVRFLRSLFDMFDGDLELALAAYHAGPRIVKQLRRVPSIPETIAYVDYIISRYSGYRPKPVYFLMTESGVPLLTNRPK
ncbi:MAG: lytic transglycosylase domain-containing protein [bacterium]